MNSKQKILHQIILQKYSSIYLGNSRKSPQKPSQKKAQDNFESAFKSITQQDALSKQQIISEIKKHPLLKFEKKAQVPKVNIENELSFQKYYDECGIQQNQQRRLISQFITNKKKQRQPVKVPQKVSVLVPTLLQTLIEDIRAIQKQKQQIKIKYFQNPKQGVHLQRIRQINDNKLKPILNTYIGKIMGINITENTQPDEFEMLMILSMSQKTFEGRCKQDLIRLLIKNLKEISIEQREHALMNTRMTSEQPII